MAEPTFATRSAAGNARAIAVASTDSFQRRRSWTEIVGNATRTPTINQFHTSVPNSRLLMQRRMWRNMLAQEPRGVAKAGKAARAQRAARERRADNAGGSPVARRVRTARGASSSQLLPITLSDEYLEGGQRFTTSGLPSWRTSFLVLRQRRLRQRVLKMRMVALQLRPKVLLLLVTLPMLHAALVPRLIRGRRLKASMTRKA